LSEPNPGIEVGRAGGVAGHARPLCCVVDDDAGICKALCFTLKKLGFETAEIATPAGLDQAMDTRDPSLIFLDLGLGQAGAMDVLPILVRHGYKGPVQLMSGRSQSVLDEFVGVGKEQGLTMLPALAKPFRMGVVKDLVARLGLAEVGPAPAAS
jgi:DNA-binding response OmpR family regulator